MLLAATDVFTYMGISAPSSAQSAIMAYIVSSIDRDIKRYCGRPLEPTLFGDGQTSEAHAGNRRTLLVLNNNPIIAVKAVATNGLQWQQDSQQAICPSPTLTPVTGTGSLAAGTYYYRASGILGGGTESIASSEVAVTLGSTGEIQIAVNPLMFASSYRLYRGTTPGGESQYTTFTPSMPLGFLPYGQLPGAYATFNDGGSLTYVAGTPLSSSSGADFIVGDWEAGTLQRDYGWDLPMAAIGWDTNWWDDSYGSGVGVPIPSRTGAPSNNIFVQYWAGYTAGGPELTEINHVAVSWAVNRWRMRDRLEVAEESSKGHRLYAQTVMPDYVMAILNTYKRPGEWLHPVKRQTTTWS